MSGQIETVNNSTLERLATALRVPAAWLTGDRDDLPYIPERLPWTKKGQSLWEQPTSAVVSESWLMQQIEAALRRDLREWFAEDANTAYKSWGHGLLTLLSELSSSTVWRMVTLLQSQMATERSLLDDSKDSPTIDWLMNVLDPWFAGRAYLNAHFLLSIFEGLVASPARLWESELTDADVRRALEQYAVACDKAEQKHLAADLGGDQG